MGEWAAQLMAKIRDRLENEADAIGVDMVADIRSKISVPVEYTDDGVIRSAPGDYPRYEFGQLWAGERHEVFSQGPVIQLNVRNDTWYARQLHDGHGNVEPRPFHDLALSEWVPQIHERAAQAITGKR